MDCVLLYVTASSPEEAEKIGRALVEQRLAACANIIPGMRSLYWWKGEICADAETVLIAKTRRELADAATARIRELHSYEVPCVVAVPITGGNPAFLDWIAAETAPAS